MKYYKDENNIVYAFESDGTQDDFIQENLVAITLEEANAIRLPKPTPEEMQSRINAEAREYLDSTDWCIVRFVETGVEIPNNILVTRQSARESIK